MTYFKTKKFWLRRLVVSLTIFICLLGLSRYPGFKELFETESALPLADVGEVSILRLHRDAQAKNTKKVHVHLYGEIDGPAILQPLEDHIPFSTYLLRPGKIDLKVEIPWEKPKISLKYSPEGAKTGMLNLKYRFSE